MAVQTSYQLDHSRLFEGQSPDQQLVNAVSRLNKSGVTIPFGLGVITDGDGAAKIPGASFVVAQFSGFVLRELNRAYADGDVFGAPSGQSMSVVTLGTIAVKTITTAVKDDPVYVDQDGTVRNDSNTAAATLIPNAKFTESGAAGSIVVISLGLGG